MKGAGQASVCGQMALSHHPALAALVLDGPRRVVLLGLVVLLPVDHYLGNEVNDCLLREIDLPLLQGQRVGVRCEGVAAQSVQVRQGNDVGRVECGRAPGLVLAQVRQVGHLVVVCDDGDHCKAVFVGTLGHCGRQALGKRRAVRVHEDNHVDLDLLVRDAVEIRPLGVVHGMIGLELPLQHGGYNPRCVFSIRETFCVK
mmetsp:Transcript_26198/g.41512  ORF Transcript_26198/g.41512 Transcript_26198/m.41512 type:complete len:200 (-) Transcript_26198:268-867(-)